MFMQLLPRHRSGIKLRIFILEILSMFEEWIVIICEEKNCVIV